MSNKSLAPWRSHLASAIHRNRSKPYSRYLQLATVTPEGYPTNRTVVFRGFLANEDCLIFITDSRSAKIQDIQAQPQAEACWYFTETREQFRLAGTLKLVEAHEADLNLQLARKTAWQSLSDAARLQFTWPNPGKPQAEKAAFELPLPEADTPLDNFCLLLLTPYKVDHLELKGEPQQRCIYILDNEQTWSTQPVNP
jgi:pyridoxamine 5'-phosphate oxidase